jgi:hypothetical protein
MYHIIYMSRSTRPISEQQLRQLLQQARANNQAAGLTGVLLYGNRQFEQVLEGEEAALRHAIYLLPCLREQPSVVLREATPRVTAGENAVAIGY